MAEETPDKIKKTTLDEASKSLKMPEAEMRKMAEIIQAARDPLSGLSESEKQSMANVIKSLKETAAGISESDRLKIYETIAKFRDESERLRIPDMGRYFGNPMVSTSSPATTSAAIALSAARTLEEANKPPAAGEQTDKEVQLARIASAREANKLAYERFMKDAEIVIKALNADRTLEFGALVVSVACVIAGFLMYWVRSDTCAGISLIAAGGASLMSFLAGRKSPRRPSAD